ncbi:hypothetical protein [Quadrisphaera sp. DSM 44207]|uniref:hypothetical protein n=1 Tax=Quadrisphaera sp. DSM 44207 TaxID=1881057 RepID=UPI00087E7D8B|nr:hypothetical protein [Quadrisphaera sp. DSM 44207]SDQ43119.1 hypothetical protein SAMN05428996_1676 [Quadrisphaera sp. DSM 44207]
MHAEQVDLGLRVVSVAACAAALLCGGAELRETWRSPHPDWTGTDPRVRQHVDEEVTRGRLPREEQERRLAVQEARARRPLRWLAAGQVAFALLLAAQLVLALRDARTGTAVLLGAVLVAVCASTEVRLSRYRAARRVLHEAGAR